MQNISNKIVQSLRYKKAATSFGSIFKERKMVRWIAALACAGIFIADVQAGAVFLTGHDPDFHSQGSGGAQNLLRTGLSYATGGSYNIPGHKFLWVESNLAPLPGHLIGENGLTAIGLIAGINFDQVNAAGLGSVNFSNYSAIAIASDFGGMLTQAELNGLIARKTDIAAFINAGGGLFASAECGIGFVNCDSSNITDNSTLFAYLPVSVNSTNTNAPYSVTAFGAGLGLTNADINDPTHNSFNVVGGLNVVDKDASGIPTTLAGIVSINQGGFTPVPEPSTLVLAAIGVAGLGIRRRRSVSGHSEKLAG